MHGALTSGSDLQYLAELLNWFCLPGGSVHGQWGAVHLEASRGRWHHHLAPTSTPRRKWTGAPITPNCKGGMCVCVCGGGCFEAGDWNLQADGQTDRSLICDCCVYWSGPPFDWARCHNTAALWPVCHTRFLLTARGCVTRNQHPQPPVWTLTPISLPPTHLSVPNTQFTRWIWTSVSSATK